jgi:hypothetical protein
MEIYLNPDNAAFTKAVCAMPEGSYGAGGKLRQEREKTAYLRDGMRGKMMGAAYD